MDESNKDTKKALREAFGNKRRAIEPGDRMTRSLLITQKAIEMPLYLEAATVMTYMHLNEEVETIELIGNIIQDKGFVILPRLDPESSTIVLHKVDKLGAGFATGPFGLSEPTPAAFPETVSVHDVNIMFMPALAIDLRGLRLGYGQGHFDRLLARRPKVFKVALAYDVQIVDELPEEEHDVRINAVVTEERTLTFSYET